LIANHLRTLCSEINTHLHFLLCLPD